VALPVPQRAILVYRLEALMDVKWKWIFTLAMSAALTACALVAQDYPATPQDGELLHVTSRLIQVEVLVRDSKGAVVRDLSRDDFMLFDQGRPRNISLFLTSSEKAVPASVRASHPLSIDNKRVSHQESANATVLLVDSLNMRQAEDLLYVRRELPGLIKELQAGDAVAIYQLAGPTIRVLHEFSDDIESLIQGAEHGRGTVGQWFRSADISQDMPERRVRIEWTIAALESIALHLAAVPGRKNLVWISSAFPITLGFESTEQMAGGVAQAQRGDLEPYQDRLKHLASILNRVDVAVYPVDPGALQVDTKYQVNFKATAPTLGGARPLQTAGEVRQGDFATMDLLASETGGRAFYSANALGQSIQAAVNDSRFAYVLGFYPDDESWDGKSHRIEVRVNRPGLTVRSRRSYFGGDTPVESPADRDAALRAAAATVLNGTAIGVTAVVASNPLETGSQRIELHIDPRDIRFENKGGKWRADFDVLLTQNAPDGRRVGGVRNQCLIERETEAEAHGTPLSLTREIDVYPAADSLRVLVRDSATGAVGSLAIPIAQKLKTKSGH
jgi:VWFA-related protein